MAMSRRIRIETGKMRELLWHFLEGQTCCFCKEPLFSADDLARFDTVRFGNATAPPLDVEQLTIHHADENHDNNGKKNRKPCHQSCHKTHHAKKVFRAYRRAA